MSDYIKREDAIFVALQQPLYSVVSQIRQLDGIDLDDYVPKDFHDKTCEAMAKRHQAEILELTTDRPQGEWIEGKYDLMCSNCENTQEYEKFPYCPYCGASMREREGE